MSDSLWNAVKPFEKALLYAYREHDGQTRKGTSIPYVSHLLAVASIVQENGGTEAEVIAALLHDAIEDQPTPAERLRVKYEILDNFGPEVLEIVEGCSDTLAETLLPPTGDKADWKVRKTEYIEHLKHATPSMRLVSAADKLHNARCILADYRELGDELWPRFNRGKTDQLWYYSSLVQAFRNTETYPRIIDEFSRTVSEIERLAC